MPKKLYIRAYPCVLTSTILPSGTEYEVDMEVKSGMHFDTISLGWAPERREEDDPPIGRAHMRRGGNILYGGEMRAPNHREEKRLDTPPPPPCHILLGNW